MLIRQARELDRYVCVDLAREFMSQAYPQYPVNHRHFDEMFSDLYRNHVLLVAEKDDGTVVGMLAAMYSSHPFNPNISVLAELAWYVYPSERKSRAGVALLKTFSALKNTDIQTLSLIDGSYKIGPLVEAEGFKLYEKGYVRFNGDE